jgi:hypothetical protein
MGTVQKKYLYEDDLSNVPLPEILASIERYKVPGVLTIEGKSFTKRLYLDEGRIIFAMSTDPDERLGEFLLYRKIISQAQYDESVRRLKAGEGRQGKILVEMKVLTPKQLFEYVQLQNQAIVYSAFNWEEGKVHFELGNVKKDEMIKLAVPILKAVFDGIKQIGDPKKLVSRLGTKTVIYGPSWDLKDVVTLRMDAAEMKLLQMVDGKRSLYELITKGPLAQPQNAKLLYAFSVLKLMEKKSDGMIKIQWKTKGDEFTA